MRPPAIPPSLDPQALEERTQAIGRELFAAAAREHEHLSVLNRWTHEVLSWCLGDPGVKSTVLRFIDVLPSLQTPRSVIQHVREYFPAHLQLPPALRLGSSLAGQGLLTAPVLAAVIRQMVEQVARQFIAESRPEGAGHIVQQLAAQGATCSLDVLGEQALSEAESNRYAEQYVQLLRDLAAAYAAVRTPPRTCGPLVNLSVKPSALTPRFDPISPANSIERAAGRLLPVLKLAADHGALVNLDMEQYELRDLTLGLVQHVLLHPALPRGAAVGMVLQAYLRDAETVLEELLAWLIEHGRSLTIRLVKGAYWDVEVAQARQRHWLIPVHEDKARTDLAFERLAVRLLSASPMVTTAIASHNVRSIASAMAAAETLGLAKGQLEFQLLYGMGDAIRAAILARGYPVRIYTPIGPLIPGMAYLVRRILENTANESFLRQDVFGARSATELLEPPMVSAEQRSPESVRRPWQGEGPLDFSRAAERDRMARAIAAVQTRLGGRYPVLLADGDVETAEQLTTRNPAHPDVVLGRVSLASLAEVNRAAQAAAEALPRWARTSVDDRVACLRRAAALMRERRHELAAWVVLEVGKSWREADLDVVEAIEYLEYYSACMEGLAQGRPLLQLPGERNRYVYAPRGVAVVIAPWNFPAAILTGMTSAALVTGNVVILKPAEQSSIVAWHVASILREAGVPPGVLQLLPGYGHEVGAALVRHPGTQVTLFTGSKAVGLSIIKASANVPVGQRFVKHVVAEMGGKNAIIVDADADLDAAIQGTVVSAFGYAGQKCSAASRVLVHEAVYERFMPRLAAALDRLVVGDPADPTTDLGPLIGEEAKHRLLDAVAQVGGVATVDYRYPAARLPAQGHFVGPAIVTGVPPRHSVAREELFGPLVCVFRAQTFGEAMAMANETDYALTGGVYSRSPSHIALAVEAFDVGNLYINRPITGALVARQPFGGHRLSGLGTKAGGPDYLLELLIPKTICESTSRHGMPLD